jgi:hypothetical protein
LLIYYPPFSRLFVASIISQKAGAGQSDTVTSVKKWGRSLDPHPVVRAGPKKAKKVANADMAELADAHGSALLTFLDSRHRK